jgi:hypothetical protein
LLLFELSSAAAAGFFVNRMPRFTLRDLLCALGFIGVGLAMLSWLMIHAPLPDEAIYIPIYLLCWFGGGGTIGAGIGALVHSRARGAVLGLIIQLLNILLLNLIGVG